jgi:anti-sigma factor RsiW
MGAVIPPADRDASRCSSIARLLGAHLDGQLDAARTVEVDDHLAQCATCRERVLLDRAIRGSLKKSVKQAAPDDLRTRMLAAMSTAASAEAEDERTSRTSMEPPLDPVRTDALLFAGARSEPQRRLSVLRHGRTMLPLAGAAAIALAWSFAGKAPLASSESVARSGAGFSNDELVNQFVEVHSHPMRPETPDPKEVRAFEREVGVPVHVPQLEKNARFVGGRLLPVQGGERAAMLQYEVAQANGSVQRVSVFVYDPRRVHIRSADQLPARAFGSAEIRVGQARGYSVAVAQHGDVGYAVASDLEDSSAQYALAVDRE